MKSITIPEKIWVDNFDDREYIAENSDFESFEEYMDAYLENTAIAPKTDPAAKRAKTQQYVDGLFSNGGAAVDHFKKLFGEEAAREIFERFVFSTLD